MVEIQDRTLLQSHEVFLMFLCDTADTLSHSLTFVRSLGDADSLTDQLVVSSPSAPAHSCSTSSSLLSTWRIQTSLFRLCKNNSVKLSLIYRFYKSIQDSEPCRLL